MVSGTAAQLTASFFLSGTVSGNQLTVGTNTRYGAMQQFGARKGQFGRTSRGAPIPWGNVPPRPWLGISTSDRAEIADILRRHLVDE